MAEAPPRSRGGGASVVHVIRRNLYLTPGRAHKQMREAEVLLCDCAPATGCGEACANRMSRLECIPGYCPCGEACGNQVFSRRQYAALECRRSGKKGFGLFAKEDIPDGGFICEYTGEVLDLETYETRKEAFTKGETGSRHTYFMSLSASEYIDASRCGNLGRFTNHSCAPNAEMQKWSVRGEVCIGLFAIAGIRKGEEITMNYNFERYDERPVRCLCGAPNCSGFMGGDPTATHLEFDEPPAEWEDEPEPELREADFEEEDPYLGLHRLLKKQVKGMSAAQKKSARRAAAYSDGESDEDYDGDERRQRRGRAPRVGEKRARPAGKARLAIAQRMSEIERRLAEPGMLEKGYVARDRIRTFVPLFSLAMHDTDGAASVPFAIKDLIQLLDAVIKIPRIDHREALLRGGVLTQFLRILGEPAMRRWARDPDPNLVATARKTLEALASLPLEREMLSLKSVECTLETALEDLMQKCTDPITTRMTRDILVRTGVVEPQAPAAPAAPAREAPSLAPAPAAVTPEPPRAVASRPAPGPAKLSDVAALLAEAPGAAREPAPPSVFTSPYAAAFAEAVRAATKHRVKKYCQKDHPAYKHVSPHRDKIIENLSRKIVDKEKKRFDGGGRWELSREKLEARIKGFVKDHIAEVEKKHSMKK